MSERHRQIEFGDFQTPLPLAEKVCARLLRSGMHPRTIIEPSCGEGSFLEAAIRIWGTEPTYYGFDINPEYITRAAKRLAIATPAARTYLETQDFFAFDWTTFLQDKEPPILFLGNPPWVTNASLGVLEANNLPKKTNIKSLNGLSALTGKANFDISEWMLLKLAEAGGCRPFAIAMLCKTGVARKSLEYYWNKGIAPHQSALYQINALTWFGAAVDACLFVADFGSDPFIDKFSIDNPTTVNSTIDKSATLYNAIDNGKPIACFGSVEGELVSNVEDYRQLKHLTGVNYYRWRSGVKHDLAKVMELEVVDGGLRNGFGVTVEVEPTHLYPLLKATEVSKGIITPRKYVLVTQIAVGEETEGLRSTAPKTWQYLERYSEEFGQRKSSIYRNQPKYCLFGIGAYSFAPYKVAISGLHKEARFTLIPPYKGKPVFVDDTCYFVGSEGGVEAELLHELFNADLTRRFITSMIFPDSKRPVTADVLNRIDIKKIAEQLGKETALSHLLAAGNVESNGQGLLVFEPTRKYARTKRSR